MVWLLTGAFGLCLLVAYWARRRAGTFRYEGETYWRRPDGSFVDRAGLPVASGAVIGALVAAHQERDRGKRGPDSGSGSDPSSSSDVSSGDDKSWWSSMFGGGSSDGSSSDSGSGDSGGGDSGGD